MRICFWGNIAGALIGNPPGGGELQIVLLAKALVKSGHEVSFVDYTIADDFVSEYGIKVYAIKGYNEGSRVIRMFHRFNLIYNSLLDRKADVYYCRIRDFRHLIAYRASRKLKAKFILALASDLDVLNFRGRIRYSFSAGLGDSWRIFNSIMCAFIYPWLLRNADMVMVQHEGQKDLLLRKHVRSKVFNNLIDLNEIPEVTDPDRHDFCYVGSLDKRKGFVQFYQLINNAPDATFKVIGSPRDETGVEYFEKLRDFSNIKLMGKLSHADTMYQIANSKALISTSPMEGFPNIFLEAWAFGIPVLSLNVDPAGVIEREKLGVAANGDLNKLLKAMSSLHCTPESVKNIKAYVGKNYALNDHRLNEICNIFNDLTGKNNPATN